MTSMTRSIRLSNKRQHWSGPNYTAPTTADPSIEAVFTAAVTDTVSHEDRNRRWRDLIRDGLNATTASSGSRGTEVFVTPGFMRAIRMPQPWAHPLNATSHKYLDWGQILWISPADVGFYTLDSSQVASNRGLVELYSHLASVQTKFKGLVFAGELPELLRLIQHPARSLRNGLEEYFRTLKKRVPRKASRSRKRKIVADTYLEWAFGIQPTLADCDDAVREFYASRQVHPIFEMVRGFGTEEKSAPGLTINWLGNTYIGYHATTTQTERKTVKYYGIYHSQGNGVPNGIRGGFNLTEFVPTLWELCPWSFLVDYFTNVGDIISSWSYRFLDLRWLATTTYQEVVLTTNKTWMDPVWPPDQGYKDTYEGSPGALTARRSKFVRTPSVSLQLPSLELQVPGMSTKWLNIAALAAGLESARRHINP